MRFVLDVLGPGDSFVDVGANVGVYSLLAASKEGVDAWAFEPSSETARMTRENIAMNGLADRVRLFQAAAGRLAGKGALTLGQGSVNRLITRDGDAVQCVESVDIVTLDETLPQSAADRVRVVKIDVEGHEVDVLLGAHSLLQSRKAMFIVERNDPDALDVLFSTYDYVACEYEPDSRMLTRVASKMTANQNLIYVPRQTAGPL